ncbi:MAG: hypothetical protein HS126_05430 [Anaerolineales bacterium]|nr:hypothetical protein [Anaerolineales bacterium]
MKLIAIWFEAYEDLHDEKPPEPEIWDLESKNALYTLYLSFANGMIQEMKAEGDCQEAIAMLRGIVQGGGSCQRVKLTPQEASNILLYEEGWECYRQGGRQKPTYIFINPAPQPQKFT